jgi:hypothetical protein
MSESVASKSVATENMTSGDDCSTYIRPHMEVDQGRHYVVRGNALEIATTRLNDVQHAIKGWDRSGGEVQVS